MVDEVIIVGAGGHCRSVIDCLISSGKVIRGILDLDYKGQSEQIMGIPVLGGYPEQIGNYSLDDVSVALAIGDNIKRKMIFSQIREAGFRMPPVIHKTAIVSESASLSEGCFIGAGCIIIGLASIGQNTIVNTGAIIDHETMVGPHCHIGPGVRVAGRVKVGAGSFLGIGVSVIDKIIIGENVTAGAGSVLIKDVLAGSTVVGVPARIIR